MKNRKEWYIDFSKYGVDPNIVSKRGSKGISIKVAKEDMIGDVINTASRVSLLTRKPVFYVFNSATHMITYEDACSTLSPDELRVEFIGKREHLKSLQEEMERTTVELKQIKRLAIYAYGENFAELL